MTTVQFVLVAAMIFGSMVVFGAIALYAMFWAARTGQFSNLDKAPESIFDDEESVGNPTGLFPGIKPGDIRRKEAR
jgi:cbb3-type cytochrome oxidase maturation protein